MHADIREDLVAIVQLLMVVVLGGRGRKPFTEAEGKKLYSDAVLTMYAHLDSMGRTVETCAVSLCLRWTLLVCVLQGLLTSVVRRDRGRCTRLECFWH